MIPLAGKPLIRWTLEAVEEVMVENRKGPFGNGNKVIISSDDEHVIVEAKRFGFTYLKRPNELCSPKTTMSDVLSFHLKDFVNEDVCVLYPTSPLRCAKQIHEALLMWMAIGSKDKTLMSVTKVMDRPYGLMSINEKNLLQCNHSYGELFYQSQSMPESYRANGAIYIIPAKMIREKKINTQLFCKNTIPFVMDHVSGHEIDNPIDVKIAESFMEWDGPTNGQEPYTSTTSGMKMGALEYVLV